MYVCIKLFNILSQLGEQGPRGDRSVDHIQAHDSNIESYSESAPQGLVCGPELGTGSGINCTLCDRRTQKEAEVAARRLHHEPQSPTEDEHKYEQAEPGESKLFHQLYATELDGGHKWTGTGAGKGAASGCRQTYRGCGLRNDRLRVSPCSIGVGLEAVADRHL